MKQFLLIISILFTIFSCEAQESSLKDTLVADSLMQLAEYNDSIENYQESVNLSIKAVSIYEKNLGKESVKYARSLSDLSYYFYETEKNQEAFNLVNEAIKIQKKIFGKKI